MIVAAPSSEAQPLFGARINAAAKSEPIMPHLKDNC
jgi:hypothetical protein